MTTLWAQSALLPTGWATDVRVDVDAEETIVRALTLRAQGGGFKNRARTDLESAFRDPPQPILAVDDLALLGDAQPSSDCAARRGEHTITRFRPAPSNRASPSVKQGHVDAGRITDLHDRLLGRKQSPPRSGDAGELR